MRLAAVVVFASVLQAPGDLPPALREVIEAERAFAARERVVGWKQAFLEYFADDAVGFNGTQSGPARAQIRSAPDPPKDAQLLWEPRYGDIAASGDLGWLTGPSTSINPARNNGAPRHGNYASVWKRQADGSFKVVIDVGVNLPALPEFAPGFTRASPGSPYRGPTGDAQASLAAADRALARATTTNQAAAYRGRLAPGARLHRHDVMPAVGEAAVLAALTRQAPFVTSEHRFAEAARSGDLGYTWGSWEKGFYVRVWARDASTERRQGVSGDAGAWKLVLDVLQWALCNQRFFRRGHVAKRTKSALKANRQNIKRREHNRQMRSKLRTALKAIRASLDAKDLDGAKTALRATVSIVDKMATKGIIHRNTAGRYKSRLSARMTKASA
jgi:ribosomal protein S20